MSMSELFAYLDRVSRKEAPLTPIEDELSDLNSFIQTGNECPEDGCSGVLWSGERGTGDGSFICGSCSVLVGGSSSPTEKYDPWEMFRKNRPRYRHSNRRRAVGGFRHEWVESDEVDGSVDQVDPGSFYR